MKRYLRQFFEPKSVVIVGASRSRGKPGNDVIRNILDNEYKGKMFLVNPRGGEILGIKVNKSISDLPPGIELAVIILPAKENYHAMEACIQRGMKVFVLAAGGFSEVDQKGTELQSQLSYLAREKNIRILGPNTSGHISTPHNFTSSFFPLGRIPKGNISYINQTGNFATHTMRYIITGENFGVARVIGLGNKIDLDENDFLEYLYDDEYTKAILMYLENISRPNIFIDIARKVTKKKPIILLKGGMSQVGMSAALAHTAALASDERVIDGAIRQAGVVRIQKYSQLIMTAKALSKMPLPHSNRISILAPSGAMLVVLTDLCQNTLGLSLPRLSDGTTKRLQEISPPFIRMRNPVDIWGAATLHGVEVGYREGLEAVLSDSKIDAVVPILLLTERTGVPSLDFIPEIARKYPEKPIYVTFSGDKDLIESASKFLEPMGIPTFEMIEDPLETLSIMVKCRQAKES
jgi:acetyltransferase